jgi:transposase
VGVVTSPQSGATQNKTSTTKSNRPRRDFAALKRRRMRAADMFRRGKSQADVARALGVSTATTCEWYRAWRQGGRAALAGAGRAGRLPRLSDDEIAELEQILLEGPRANGFATGLWTLARVAEVIETRFGVRYSQTQTWEIMRRRLGWTRQRPARRAIERDDEAIASWVQNDWPRIKKVPGGGGHGSSSRTSPGSPSSPR